MSRKSKYPKVKKNGSVYYRARIPNPYVKSGYSDVYGKTVRECDEKRQKKEEQIKAGILDSNTRFGDYLKQIYDDKIVAGLKESSKKQYSNSKTILIESPIANRRLTDLTPRELNSWLSSLELSNTTYSLVSILLRKILKQAFKDGLLIRDLSITVETPKADNRSNSKRPGRLLSDSEINELLERLSDPDRILSMFLLDTGLRVGEALALDWTDIDVENNTVNVFKTITRSGQITAPKTKTSIRTVPVSPRMVAILKRERLRQNENAIHYAGLYDLSDKEAVFKEDSGKRIKYGTYIDRLKRSGLDICPHDFRHTTASRLNESGISPLVIAKWLGHSKIDTTVNVYTDVTENLERSSLKILNGAKNGAK